MRIRLTKFCAYLTLLSISFLSWKTYQNIWFSFSSDYQRTLINATKQPTKHVTKLLTVVIRDFDLSENDVVGTVESFIHLYPNLQILIVTNGNPYPPLKINFKNDTFKNVRLINLNADFEADPITLNPLNLIRTQYALFVPDSTRILNRHTIVQIIKAIRASSKPILAIPYTISKNLTGWDLKISQREWTAHFGASNGSNCNFISGKHAIVIGLNTLYKVRYPFILPHPHSLYLQTSVLGFKAEVIKNIQFQDGKPLFYSHHSQRQKTKNERKLLKQLYETYAIKRVVSNKGTVTFVENYGCRRDTPTCFGTIINNVPSYIYENKTTPPCCLENLRKTARHVFASLQESGIRFWLEGASLLGAMKLGDIIPWDFDVDVGFNRDDLARCIWLKKAKSKPTVDTKGFVWEKATEGNFYKVLYSKVNRIHVNLLPFYYKNGSMIRDSWFSSRTSSEFPDRYLHPMASIEFLGQSVPSPNNIRDFLEYKFSPDIVDSDDIPDFSTKLT